MSLDSQSDSSHGRRSVEGVLTAAGFGPDRKYAEFYRLARELRKYALNRGWDLSYDDALELISAAMGYTGYKFVRIVSRGGVVKNREPSTRHLDSPEYRTFVKLDAAGGYKAGEFTVTAVPSADGEAVTLGARFKQYLKSFFK